MHHVKLEAVQLLCRCPPHVHVHACSLPCACPCGAHVHASVCSELVAACSCPARAARSSCILFATAIAHTLSHGTTVTALWLCDRLCDWQSLNASAKNGGRRHSGDKADVCGRHPFVS
eukprot:363801-Chlamydomonas_euryale.AAC.21